MVLFHCLESLLTKDQKISAVLFVFLFLLTACGGSDPESTDVLADTQGLPDIPGGWKEINEEEQKIVRSFEEYLDGAESVSPEDRQAYLRTTLGINNVDCDETSCTMIHTAGTRYSYIFSDSVYDATISFLPSTILPKSSSKPTYSSMGDDNRSLNQSCPKKKNALILNPFHEQFKSAQSAIINVEKNLRNAGYEVEMIPGKEKEADLSGFDFIKNDDYSIVLIASHGMKNGTIATGEKVTFKNILVPWDKNISLFRVSGIGWHLAINPSWWDGVELSERAFLFSTCNNFAINSKLRTLFESADVGFVHGYTSQSRSPYNTLHAAHVIDKMVAADEVKDTALKAYETGTENYFSEIKEHSWESRNGVNAPIDIGYKKYNSSFSLDPDICAAGDDGQLDSPTAPNKPDLVVTSIEVPSSAQPGDDITPKVTVANQGNADADKFYTGYYLSTDSTITTSDSRISGCRHDSGRAAGESRACGVKINLPSDLSPDTYYFGAIADYKNQVLESDESNNTRASDNTITIQNKNPSDPPAPSNPPTDPPAPSDPPAQSALPDLVVTSIKAPNEITVGEKASITVTIKNQGTAGTSAGSPSSTFKTGCYLSDDSIMDYDPATHSSSDFRFDRCVHQNNLGSGSTAICTCEVTFPSSGNYAGNSYYFGAVVDHFNHIWSESNENNNTYIKNSRVQIQ